MRAYLIACRRGAIARKAILDESERFVLALRATHIPARHPTLDKKDSRSATSSAVRTDRASLQTLRARSSAVKECACRTVEGAGACPTGAFPRLGGEPEASRKFGWSKSFALLPLLRVMAQAASRSKPPSRCETGNEK